MRPIVLVVDDDDDIREVLLITLDEYGYDVVGARDGSEALALLQGQRPLPSVILLDLMMPVMNGAQFRERQLRDPELAKIPIIVLSGADQVARQARELGVAGFCEKPVHLDNLLDLLSSHSKGKRSGSASAAS